MSFEPFSPVHYRIAHRRMNDGDEQSAASTVQDTVSEANRNHQGKGQINIPTYLALTMSATDVGGSKWMRMSLSSYLRS